MLHRYIAYLTVNICYNTVSPVYCFSLLFCYLSLSLFNKQIWMNSHKMWGGADLTVTKNSRWRSYTRSFYTLFNTGQPCCWVLSTTRWHVLYWLSVFNCLLSKSFAGTQKLLECWRLTCQFPTGQSPAWSSSDLRNHDFKESDQQTRKTNHHLYESIMSLSPVRVHLRLTQSQNWLAWQRPLDPRCNIGEFVPENPPHTAEVMSLQSLPAPPPHQGHSRSQTWVGDSSMFGMDILT